MSLDLSTLTIATAHQALLEGRYTVADLVEAYRSAIAERNEALHAYLHLFSDISQQVEQAQRMYDQGEATPLTGIPLAVKANLQVQGEVCNAASKMLENYRAVYDATAIARLRQAGAIFLGSANCDEFAMGGSTENSAFGPTRNPHDPSRVPGGSSGGSAAAVASAMALAALGTDTGGSVRQPGSFCGVVGFKGSYGSVSRYGAAAMGSSLDQIGPLARTVEDARALFRVMRGPDEFDMTALPEETWQERGSRPSRLAVPQNFLQGLDSEVERVYLQSLETLRQAGYEVVELDVPCLELALPVYYILMPAEVSSNLARYDGIRYGFKAEGTEDLLDEYVATRTQGLGSEVKRRIVLGTYVLSAGYAERYYTRALALREKIKEELSELFATYDALVTPTSPVPPFPLGEKVDDPLSMYLSDIYTVGANIAGLPAISVPAGETAEGLPVGIHLLGPHGRDEDLLDLAGAFEQAVGSESLSGYT